VSSLLEAPARRPQGAICNLWFHLALERYSARELSLDRLLLSPRVSVQPSDGVNRYQFNARVSDLDLAESYLPSFESCVRGARAASIMCAYNAVNEVPACADPFHLKTIARERWGFDGFVVSDCGAIGGIMHEHNYTRTVEDTVAAAMHAGVDLNCQSRQCERGPAEMD